MGVQVPAMQVPKLGWHRFPQLQKNELKQLKSLRRVQNWGIIPLTQVRH
jgi:hypothetical protein